MKPQLLRVPIGAESSFSVRQDVVLHFYDRWHYHPELELLHIEQGTGTQFVGDNIQNFQSGDVLLIGANLPHYWRCDQKYFDNQTELFAQATVVHFRADFWGDAFLKLPENRAIAQLLDRAKQGIRIQGTARTVVANLLKQMLTATGTQRIITLLTILTAVAASPETTLISTTDYPDQFDEADTDRINRIYAYALANFQRKISVAEVAAVANLSPHSFCRYFKSRSRKPFSQFLLELRVHHACKLLTNTDLSISQVCMDSGFNQFSGFNKYVKQITGKSPMQYRKLVRK